MLRKITSVDFLGATPDSTSYLNWRRYISAATILGGNLEKVVSEMTIKHLSPGSYFINGERAHLFFTLLRGAPLCGFLRCSVRRDFLLFSCFHGSRRKARVKCVILFTAHLHHRGKKLKEQLLCLDSRVIIRLFL